MSRTLPVLLAGASWALLHVALGQSAPTHTRSGRTSSSSTLEGLSIYTIARQAYLKASDTGVSDRFGDAVAISGKTVVIGASWDDSGAVGVNGDQNNNFKPQSGAAYAFDLGFDAWTDLASGLAGSSGAPLLAGSGPLATDPSGALSLPFLWPSNVPPGTALYFQVWISGPGAISGFSASNALEGVSS